MKPRLAIAAVLMLAGCALVEPGGVDTASSPGLHELAPLTAAVPDHSVAVEAWEPVGVVSPAPVEAEDYQPPPEPTASPAASPTPIPAPTSAPVPSGWAEGVVAATNAARTGRGLAPLTVSACASEHAQQRAQALIGRPLEHAPLAPVQAACGTGYVGENLAVGYPDPEATVNAWIASPGHAANLFDPHFHAIAVACTTDAPVVCVQLFTD